MPRITFQIDDVAVGAQLSAWRDVLTNFALLPGFRETPRRLCGRVDHVYSSRGVGFSIMESAPQRLCSAVDRSGEDMFFLATVTEGRSTVEVDGRTVDFLPGDILYGRRGAVGALDMHTPFRFFNVNIPTAVLTRAMLMPLPTNLIHLRRETASTRVLAAMLTEIANSMDRLDEASAFAIEAALIQLLVGSVFEGAGVNPLGGLASARAALLRRIWQTIETRLQDRELSLGEIAAEHRLSPRYIQLLFEESGQSFRTYVRRRRLEKCRADLANPLNANMSITSVCLHWGFGDSASFSHAFREAYGCAPTTARRQALEGRVDPRKRLYGLGRGA